MIGPLIALLSLDVAERLIAQGLIAATLTIVAASNTAPVVIETQAPHGYVRPVDGIVSGVAGNDGANGSWRCTPTDATHLSLSRYDQEGTVVDSVGTGGYVSGGTLVTAFPDGTILLGRRNIAMHTAVATPRIVFVPTDSPAWDVEPYGGIINAPGAPHRLSTMTAEQRTMLQSRQLSTEKQRFEMHVTGCASPADPDFGDFDVTQNVVHTLYASMFDLLTPKCFRVLSGRWASQEPAVQQLDVRGQRWVGVVEIMLPVIDPPLQFVPAGVVGEIDVALQNAASGDTVVIELPGAPL